MSQQERMTVDQYRAAQGQPPTQSRPNSGGMNKWEAAFAEVLRDAERVGLLGPARFEAVKLRIGDRCWYTPDFETVSRVTGDNALATAAWEFRVANLLWQRHGAFVYWEVKGHWRDDARVKIKAAAARYPERLFVAVTRDRPSGAWQYEVIRAR